MSSSENLPVVEKVNSSLEDKLFKELVAIRKDIKNLENLKRRYNDLQISETLKYLQKIRAEIMKALLSL